VFYIVITDLDGTLLDHQTYSYRDALPAIRLLQQSRVPLILCSSKTAAEMIHLQEELGLEAPLIVENGGAVYLRPGLFQNVPYDIEVLDGWERIALGIPYPKLKEALLEVAGALNLQILLFEDWTVEELEHQVGLKGEAAVRASKREFDIPFRLIEMSRVDQLEAELRAKGLNLSRGGRFLHVTGKNDKGRAAQILAELYGQLVGDRVMMIGLGDSENDRPLLEVVNYPVLVPNPVSSSPIEAAIPALRIAPEPGPAGWNQAIQDLMVELQIGRQVNLATRSQNPGRPNSKLG